MKKIPVSYLPIRDQDKHLTKRPTEAVGRTAILSGGFRLETAHLSFNQSTQKWEVSLITETLDQQTSTRSDYDTLEAALEPLIQFEQSHKNSFKENSVFDFHQQSDATHFHYLALRHGLHISRGGTITKLDEHLRDLADFERKKILVAPEIANSLEHYLQKPLTYLVDCLIPPHCTNAALKIDAFNLLCFFEQFDPAFKFNKDHALSRIHTSFNPLISLRHLTKSPSHLRKFVTEIGGLTNVLSIPNYYQDSFTGALQGSMPSSSAPTYCLVTEYAAYRPVEDLETLIQAGSDLQGYPLSQSSPIVAAIDHNRPENALYLASHGAFDHPLKQGGSLLKKAPLLTELFDDERFELLDALCHIHPDLYSEQHFNGNPIGILLLQKQQTDHADDILNNAKIKKWLGQHSTEYQQRVKSLAHKKSPYAHRHKGILKPSL